jgi:hypothetical protein
MELSTEPVANNSLSSLMAQENIWLVCPACTSSSGFCANKLVGRNVKKIKKCLNFITGTVLDFR